MSGKNWGRNEMGIREIRMGILTQSAQRTQRQERRGRKFRVHDRKIMRITPGTITIPVKATVLLIIIFICIHCDASDKSEYILPVNTQINDNIGVGKDLRQRMNAIRLNKMLLIIDGKHDCDVIDKQIQKNLPRLSQIYNNRLRAQPGITGWSGFQFFIDKHGRAIKCEIVESTVNDEKLKDFLKDDINKWRFIPLEDMKDSTRIYFPFCCGSFCGSYNGIVCNGKLINIGK